MKLLFTVLLLLPLSVVAQRVDTSHELLWEISGNGIETSYLFGTMHTNDRRVYNLSDSTYIALDQAEIIACEVDIFSAFEDLVPLIETVDLNYDKYFLQGDQKGLVLEDYHSHNTYRLTNMELKELLLALDCIQAELNI